MAIDFEGILRLPPEKQVDSLKAAIEELKDEIKNKKEGISGAEELLAKAVEATHALQNAEVPVKSIVDQLRLIEPVSAPAEQVDQKKLDEELLMQRRLQEQLEGLVADTPQAQQQEDITREQPPTPYEQNEMYQDNPIGYDTRDEQIYRPHEEERREESRLTESERLVKDTYHR